MIRSRIVPLLALLLAVAVAVAMPGQSRAQGTAPIYPPASRVGLVPPPGFVPAPNFSGFIHNDKRASILVADLPGYAFDSIDKQIATDLQKETNAPVSRADIALKNGGTGFILFGHQGSPQGSVLRWTLVAHVGDATAVITAIIPEQVQEVAPDDAIRTSFATVSVRQVPVAEQLSVLPFAMNDLGGFRIVRVQPGSAAMLTDGPKDAIEVNEQPLLLIAIAGAQDQPPPNERDGFARRMFGEIAGLKDVRVVRSEPLRVAGQQGYELLVEARDGKADIDVTAVQWLRFGTGTLLRIVGIARKDAWPTLYPRFRQFRDGIGPK